jgi:hypothetical protein
MRERQWFEFCGETARIKILVFYPLRHRKWESHGIEV